MSGPGGWNQPPESFGPDPNASQPYYTEPYPSYGPEYGQPDPYAQPDPHGQYGQYAQYPQTGGFYGPPLPPPKRSKLPMILSLVAIVIIVGAVVAIVLVNRKGDQQPAANSGDDTTSSQEPSEPSKKTTDPEPSGDPDNTDDWLTIDNSAEAGLIYQVPPDWKQSAQPRESGFEGLPFSGAAEYGVYDCDGSTYVRTFATSGSVQAKDGGELSLETTVKDFANSFGATYYGADAQIDVAEPAQTELDGKEAMTLTAKIIPQVGKPDCEAVEGEVAVVGVLLEAEGKATGVSMLVVVNDTKGGPETPKPAPPSVSRDIFATVKTG